MAWYGRVSMLAFRLSTLALTSNLLPFVFSENRPAGVITNTQGSLRYNEIIRPFEVAHTWLARQVDYLNDTIARYVNAKTEQGNSQKRTF